MATVSKDFADRVFEIKAQHNPIWEGASAEFGQSFAGVIERLIDEKTIDKPGYYCIIRLDRTVRPDAMPELMFVCTVTDNFNLFGGVVGTASNITFWPPK